MNINNDNNSCIFLSFQRHSMSLVALVSLPVRTRSLRAEGERDFHCLSSIVSLRYTIAQCHVTLLPWQQVYLEPMSNSDLVFITCSIYPDMNKETVQRMVTFNNKVLINSIIYFMYICKIYAQ